MMAMNNEADKGVDVLLDACHLYCPEPVMMLHNAIRGMQAGQVLSLIATDPSTQRDVPKFCIFLGHELISAYQKDEKFHYLIKKKSG